MPVEKQEVRDAIDAGVRQRIIESVSAAVLTMVCLFVCLFVCLSIGFGLY